MTMNRRQLFALPLALLAGASGQSAPRKLGYEFQSHGSVRPNPAALNKVLADLDRKFDEHRSRMANVAFRENGDVDIHWAGTYPALGS